jgi:hypothetical protein
MPCWKKCSPSLECFSAQIHSTCQQHCISRLSFIRPVAHMDHDQSQFRISHRVRANPPLQNGDTAGGPDPYAASPYGGPLETESNYELGPSAGQMYSYLLAPTGTSSFEQYSSPSIDSGVSYQNSSLWDGLASDSFLPEWNLVRDAHGIQSLQMDQQSFPATAPILPSNMQSLYMDRQFFLDATPMVIPNIPSTNNEPGMHCRYNAIPNQIMEQNLYYRTNDPGDEMDWGSIDDSVLTMGQTHQQPDWETNQLNLHNDLGGVAPQNSLDRPLYEMGESHWEQMSDSNPPLRGRPKPKMRTASRSKVTIRSRSERPAPTYKRLNSKEIGIPGFFESQAEFGELCVGSQVGHSDRSSSGAISRKRPQAQDACVGCRDTKRKVSSHVRSLMLKLKRHLV